jgi:hypothetical protein
MTQLELDFGEEFARPPQVDETIALAQTISDGWWLDDDKLKAFADLIRTDFMDKLIAHPSICRQIIDAGLLSSNPAGFKARGLKTK